MYKIRQIFILSIAIIIKKNSRKFHLPILIVAFYYNQHFQKTLSLFQLKFYHLKLNLI